MRKTVLFLVLFLLFSNLFSYELTHEMTPEEAKIKDFNKDFYETEPPTGPIRNIAEFDKMEGVLVRYPFGIPISLIADMSNNVKVTTIVANQSQQNTVLDLYENNGVNIDNCNFLIAPTDSYWTRDYGPWYIAEDDYNIAIVNFPYNRPRPNDNDIPIEMADFLGINLYGMNVTHTGGNYMTDGMGISASSTLVWDENPSLSHEEINQKMHDYLGINTYHVVPDPNNTYINHIDCWGKYLAPDKILIRSVPTTHPQYDEIEATAEYFANQISSYGTPYRVYRVYTPSNQPYTNSLILNNKVYVPIVNSPYDQDALDVYQEAMPGYQIIGVQEDPSHPWESTDALHCRTKGIADRNMLYVEHIPISGNVENLPGSDYQITAQIIPYSHQPVVLESTKVYYKVNDGEFQAINMEYVSGYTYTANIPQQEEGTEVAYYIHSVDQAGNSANHPFIGAADAHKFHVGQPVPPELVVNPTEFNINMNTDETENRILSLTNNGEGEINYTIQISETDLTRNIDGSSVTMDLAEFSPGLTYNATISVYNASNDDEWLTDVTLQFPQGVTVNSSTDLEGGTSPLISDNTTGNGATIHWSDADGGYGNIHPNETATATINFTVSGDFSSDMTLNYSITGDQWESEPHYIEGTITLTNAGEPITWISLSQTQGTLGEYDTDEIGVTFDSNNLEEGIYTCNIIITDDRDITVIPVTLNISTTSSSNTEISSSTFVCYPNPVVLHSGKSRITFKSTTKDIYRNGKITLYNLKGEVVNRISLEKNIAYWNLKSSNQKTVAPGIYFYKIDNSTKIHKFIILK